MDDENLRICISSQRENLFQTKHTIKDPNFFDIDKILNDYITNNKKNISYFLSKVTSN